MHFTLIDTQPGCWVYRDNLGHLWHLAFPLTGEILSRLHAKLSQSNHAAAAEHAAADSAASIGRRSIFTAFLGG